MRRSTRRTSSRASSSKTARAGPRAVRARRRGLAERRSLSPRRARTASWPALASPYSIFFSTRAGVPRRWRKRGCRRDDRVCPDHAPLADRHPSRDHDVGPAPDVVADRRRPLGRKALPGDGLVGVVEAVVGVRDEAAIGEHAVLTDLDKPAAAIITPMFRNAAAPDPDPRLSGAVSHTSGSNSTPSPISSRPSLSASSTLPCSGQRANAPPAHQLIVDPRSVPGQRIALIPGPFLGPQLELGGCRGGNRQVRRRRGRRTDGPGSPAPRPPRHRARDPARRPRREATRRPGWAGGAGAERAARATRMPLPAASLLGLARIADLRA